MDYNRKYPAQINFRASAKEKESYDALAEAVDMPLSRVIRQLLKKAVKRNLGAEWAEYLDEG